MGLIKKKDIWQKAALLHLEWKNFFPSDFSMEEEKDADEAVNKVVFSEPAPLAEKEEKQSFIEKDVVIKEAQHEAARIIEEAKKEGKKIREGALKKGFDEGGKEAEKKMEEKYKALFEEEISKIVQIGEALQSSYKDIVSKAEGSLVKLSLDIAKKVIKDECSEREAVVLNMVKEGLSRVSEKTEICVKVNPQQLPVVKENREAFLSQLGKVDHFEMVSDAEIDKGGCLIETDSGSIDLRIKKQFAEVKESLTGEAGADEDF